MSTTGEASLRSWKEIAGALGRDVKTAQRWEARGLPVHRVPGAAGRSTIYAYRSELERWLQREETPPDTPASVPVPAIVTAGAEDGPLPVSPDPARATSGGRSARLWPWAALGGGAVLAVILLLGGVGTTTTSRTAPQAARSHPKPATVELYRRGRYEWSRRTPESLHAALADFTQAIVQDPDYADAYVGLADTYNLLREYTGMPDSEAYPQAERAARRAVALDERSAAAHAALAFVEFHWGWDAPAATRDFERAIALDPKNSTARAWYATALLDLGDYPAALRQIEEAEALAPESAAIRADRGCILLEAGKVAAAEALLRQMSAADPQFLSPHLYLSHLYFKQRRYPEYLRELGLTAKLKGDEASRLVLQASEAGYRSGGEQGLLAGALKAKESLYEQGKIDDLQLATAYAQAHRTEESLKHLAAAVARHNPDLLYARTHADFADVRTRPEFAAIFAKAPPGDVPKP